jgi:autotransporter translocation and assembly factor TamB
MGEDFVFERFAVDTASIALTTVRRLVPSVIVDGRMGGRGTLDGSWLNATFAGTFWHRDAPHPPSQGRGSVRIDARTDLVGIWADLDMDSLRLAGFASLYDSATLGGAWAGRISLGGSLDSLPLEEVVDGDAGAVRVTGNIFAVDTAWGLRDVVADINTLDLRVFNPLMPRTRLNGRAALALHYQDSVPVLTLRLDLGRSVVEGVPIDTAFGTGRMRGTALVADTVAVRGLATQLHGAGAFGMRADGPDTLSFTARTDSLGVVEPLLQRLVGLAALSAATERPSGRVSVVGRIVGRPERFQVYADVGARDVRRETAYVSAAGASIAWVSDTDILGVDFDADSIAVGSLSVARLHGRLHGRPDSLVWDAQSAWGEAAWRGFGRWVRDTAALRVDFDSLRVLLHEVWSIDPGASVAVDDSGVTIIGVAIQNRASGAHVSVNGRWPFAGSAELHGSLEAVQVPDLLMLALKDTDIGSGELQGTFTLRGRAQAPIIDASLEMQGGRYGEFIAPLVRGRLTYAERRVDGRVELRRLGVPVLDVTIGLPMDLALAPRERRRLSGPVAVRAQADSVDLSLLEATFPPVQDIGGTFDADLGIEGTWDDPRLTGRVTLRDGAATFPALGVRHEAMNGELRLVGDTIHVERLSLLSGGGRATVAGFVRLEELSVPLVALTIQTQDFHVINVPGFVTLTASADLALDGPLLQATLTGQGRATRGVLHFADLMTKNVVNLEDTLFAEFVDTALVRSEGLGADFQNRLLDSLRIDSLRVDMGQDFWLRSTEANVLLTGNIFVNKLRNRYRIDGTLQAPRGTYRLPLALGISRDFAVTGGQIRYLGTPDLNADLDIDAEHIVRGTAGGKDVEVYVNIGGTMYDPRVTLTSDFQPTLSEPEIINYLLFGASSLRQGTTTAGFESRLLAQWLSTTVSGQLEYALISDLGVPLDYLQIRPTTGASGVTGAEVAVGKQFRLLGTTAFLTASPRYCRNRATSLASVGASLEFRLSRSWVVAASVDPLVGCESTGTPTAGTYQFGADLFWEKTY